MHFCRIKWQTEVGVQGERARVRLEMLTETWWSEEEDLMGGATHFEASWLDSQRKNCCLCQNDMLPTTNR